MERYSGLRRDSGEFGPPMSDKEFELVNKYLESFPAVWASFKTMRDRLDKLEKVMSPESQGKFNPGVAEDFVQGMENDLEPVRNLLSQMKGKAWHVIEQYQFHPRFVMWKRKKLEEERK